MKKIVIIGSTGSIGRQTLEVVRAFPEKFRVLGLGAGRNWRLLLDQVKEFSPKAVALSDESCLNCLRNELKGRYAVDFLTGRGGMEALAAMPQADTVVVAVSGAAGIYPTIAALAAGKRVALANKETLVAAGHIVMNIAARNNSQLLPVDSEHSAVWQCLEGKPAHTVEKVILTASGGPFRELSRAELETVTPKMALKHPNWEMGAKITVDSATLMNKGLEVIEAKWLFNLNYRQIEVVIHPQSIIHSAVEFIDGSVMAQMSLPDMRLPIQYALAYPVRLRASVPRLKLTDLRGLTFEEPDLEKFPALQLAIEAGMAGGSVPAVLNAANEVAVECFLKGAIRFLEIPQLVRRVVELHKKIENPCLEEIMEADRWARDVCYGLAGVCCIK